MCTLLSYYKQQTAQTAGQASSTQHTERPTADNERRIIMDIGREPEQPLALSANIEDNNSSRVDAEPKQRGDNERPSEEDKFERMTFVHDEEEETTGPGDDLLALSHRSEEGFLKSSHLSCILYRAYAWRRHANKEKAVCPNCKAQVTCKDGNTSNIWRHFKA